MSKSNAENDTGDGCRPTEVNEGPEVSEGPEVFRAHHAPDGPGTVSDTVIEAIADVADVDPTQTVIPLTDSVDPDALDALFADREAEVQVSFRVYGLDVLVRSDGRIRIVDDAVWNAE